MAEPSDPPRREPRVPAVVWESLYVRGLRLEGPALAELKAAGFDPDRLETSYPLALFRKSEEIVRRHLFPTRTDAQVYWELGRRTMQGFGSTLVGKVITVGIPLLGPARYLRRIPDHAKVGGLDMVVTPVPLGEREYRLEFRKTLVTPEYAAGLIEVGLELCRVKPTIRPERVGDTGFDLHIRW